MAEVKYRYRVADPKYHAETGITAKFICIQMLTADDFERLKAFWASRPNLQDGEIVRV